MARQITVGLPDDLVRYLDEVVASGRAPNRSHVVARALERDRSRVAAEHDYRVLLQTGPSDDLDGLVEWATEHADWDD